MQMIYGSISSANTHELAEIEKQNVANMMAALGSYPWDSQSMCGLKGAAFGVHARGEQPASLPKLDGLILAADARLDNRPELYAAIGIDAAEGASLDDSGLILRAYLHWGTGCASHLLGDFAFVLRDEANGRVFCARDFIGARPFYYHHAPDRFVFASDLQALAAHPDVPMRLNLAHITATLQNTMGQFMHPEHTYYQELEKLPPAHCLTLDDNGLHCWAYWQAGQTPERRYPDEREYVEELRALLNEAVACRVTSPYLVGAHISGGLDSSSVAVLAQRILQKKGRSITGFSWAPPLPQDPADLLPNDERKLVEAVRAAEGFAVHYTRLTPAHILAYARRDHTLQPTATLQYELAASEEAAGMGVHTMLSGWGGDELPAFNGRGYFSDLFRRGCWFTLQRELTLRAQLQGGTAWKPWIFECIFPLIPTPILQRLRPKDFPPPHPLPAYLRPDFASSLSNVKPLIRSDGRERPGVRRMQIALLQHGHLSYRMESWASHGATLGLTYAYPLLDQRVVEFALSIPDYLFFKNGWKRYLYRTTMDGILPDILRWQKVKEDPAMIQVSRNVHKQAAKQQRTELLARTDNPFVDVARLQEALGGEEDNRDAFFDSNLTQTQRRRVILQMSAWRGRWLAFVNNKVKA
jgi:asparagine synthase (glutamine-hydrolysing)